MVNREPFFSATAAAAFAISFDKFVQGERDDFGLALLYMLDAKKSLALVEYLPFLGAYYS